MPTTHKSNRLDADLLSQKEIESLITACSNKAPTGIRNRALIAMAWRTGLRLGEILALRLKDLDLDAGLVTVQHGKGDKHRIVGLDPGAAALIQRWLSVRARIGITKSAPVFSTLSGQSIDQSYVRHLLPRLAQRAGIDKRVHAHGLRHAFAVDLEREGATLTTIRDLLGHSSASVTDRYLRRHGASDAIAFSRSREWNPSVRRPPARLPHGDPTIELVYGPL
jgi:site-specific recombinase XerD